MYLKNEFNENMKLLRTDIFTLELNVNYLVFWSTIQDNGWIFFPRST